MLSEQRELSELSNKWPSELTSQSLHWRSLRARRSASLGLAKAPLFPFSRLGSGGATVKPPANSKLWASACKLFCFRSTVLGFELLWLLFSSSSMLSSRCGFSSAGMFRRSTTLSLLQSCLKTVHPAPNSLPWYCHINFFAKVCSWPPYCRLFFKLFWHSLSPWDLAGWHQTSRFSKRQRSARLTSARLPTPSCRASRAGEYPSNVSSPDTQVIIKVIYL